MAIGDFYNDIGMACFRLCAASTDAFPLKKVPLEAYAPVSNTQLSVSPLVTVTLSSGTQNASLITFAEMVSSPVPRSAPPLKISNVPSVSSFAHDREGEIHREFPTVPQFLQDASRRDH